jgi:hypothetical protein
MWECEKCGSVFDKKDNQRLTCAKCGGKRRPPSKDTVENAVLQIFSKFANIKFKPLKAHEERSEFANHILAPKLKTKQRQALFIFSLPFLKTVLRVAISARGLEQIIVQVKLLRLKRLTRIAALTTLNSPLTVAVGTSMLTVIRILLDKQFFTREHTLRKLQFSLLAGTFTIA